MTNSHTPGAARPYDGRTRKQGHAVGNTARPACRGHVCHANGCDVAVPPKMLMCVKHWWMVPKPLRDRIWATYRLFQEVNRDPTPEYMQAVHAAIDAVARKEGTI